MCGTGIKTDVWLQYNQIGSSEINPYIQVFEKSATVINKKRRGPYLIIRTGPTGYQIQIISFVFNIKIEQT